MINVEKIISGGQTGVDRAALDFALARRIKVGGWCPKGRKAEDGLIPGHYPLLETHRTDYPYRTILNVMDADGTIILFWGQLRGGSALTWQIAMKHKSPCLLVDLHGDWTPQEVVNWLEQNTVRVLNVAGPRESENRGIHGAALQFFQQLWDA